MIITKSYTPETIYEKDGRAFAEGWVSTPDRDLEHDEVPPEAFTESLDGYFSRGAPVSSVHDTLPIPAGYMQKAVLVRDGKILHTTLHPVDPADFEAFPEQGTGWYGRIMIDDPKTARAIKAGKIRSFSWIGRIADKEDIPGGRWRYKSVNPLMEATVAAYPVNPHSVMIATKATSKDTHHMDPEQITTLIADILTKREAEKEALAKKASEEAAMKALLEKVEALEKKNTDLEEEVKKSQIPQREEGTGRKGAPTDQDPFSYLTQKALKQEALTPEDKYLIAELTVAYMTQGMTE